MSFSKKLLSILLFVTMCAGPAHAKRIISLLPSNTEILQAVGAGPEIVGVTRFDELLTQTTAVASIGDFIHPNVEKIVELKPDLIVAGYWTSSHIVPHFKKMGYTVLEVRPPKSLEEIYASIRVLAQAADRPHAAEPVIQNMKDRLEKVRQRAKHLPRRLKTYIEVDRPYWTIGTPDYLSEALALAGADNIFSDLKRQAAQVSPEVILERQPDLIIAFKAKRTEIAARPGWQTLPAVKSGLVLDDLPENALSRSSPPLVQGIEIFIERLEKLERQ